MRRRIGLDSADYLIALGFELKERNAAKFQNAIVE